MRLELVRSGGIAGLEQRRTLDTAKLTADEARELEELVAAADLDALARRSPIRERGADRFQYDLRVEKDGTTREVTLWEDQVPGQVAGLLERVWRLGNKST